MPVRLGPWIGVRAAVLDLGGAWICPSHARVVGPEFRPIEQTALEVGARGSS